MTKKQEEMYNALIGLTAERAVSLILDFRGVQLLDNEFYDHLIEEGILEEKIIEYEDNDEEEEEEEKW